MIFEDKDHLILSGGGSKGWVLLGLLQSLKDQGHLKNLKAISATSVGSLIAVIYISNNFELYDTLMRRDVLSSEEIDITLLFEKFGFNDGMFIQNSVDFILETVYSVKDCTMKQFYELSGVELYISSSNITKGCLEYFNHRDTPDLSVGKAVRMSCTIPIFFTKIEYNGNFYADGGLMVSFAIHPFLDIDSKQILSIELLSTESFKYDKIVNIFEYLSNLINCLLQANVSDRSKYDNILVEYNAPLLIMNQTYEDRKLMYDFGYNYLKTTHAE
tara:strand:- start:1271 stop:2089 length:819 start_codon:yes stop_codon:yes gene_type:complete